MNCNFYVNNERLYTPRDRRITGILTLSSSSETKDIQSITYGIKSQIQLLPHYDSHGNITNPVVYNYHYHMNSGYIFLNRKTKAYLHENPNIKEIFIVNDTIMNDVIENEKLIKKADSQWTFPVNETIVRNFDLEFPTADEWFLPSSCYSGFKSSTLYHYTVQIKYYVYVRVNRRSTILKKNKCDEFVYDIDYQSGVQFPSQLRFLPYRENRVFKSKMSKPGLDKDTASYDAGDIASTSYKPKFLRRFLNRKEGVNIPFTIDFNVQNLISIYQPLPEQFGLKFEFDFNEVNFPLDFGTEKSSSGLGLFQIDSLKVKVKYSNSVAIVGSNARYDQSSQKILEFDFKDLIYDMKNAVYNAETKTGTLTIPPEAFMSQLNLHLPLEKITNLPIVTTCDVFDVVQNFTTLEFNWVISDTDNKLKFSFKTDSTISAELDSDSAPPYADPIPTYDDVKAEDSLQDPIKKVFA